MCLINANRPIRNWPDDNSENAQAADRSHIESAVHPQRVGCLCNIHYLHRQQRSQISYWFQ